MAPQKVRARLAKHFPSARAPDNDEVQLRQRTVTAVLAYATTRYRAFAKAIAAWYPRLTVAVPSSAFGNMLQDTLCNGL